MFIYRRCVKPIKPKTTITVVADTKSGPIIPIYIFSSHLRNDSILIAHGSSIKLTFEELVSTELFFNFHRAGFTICSKSLNNLTRNYTVRVSVKENTVSQHEMSMLIKFLKFVYYSEVDTTSSFQITSEPSKFQKYFIILVVL